MSRDKLQNSGRFTEKIVTQIEPATTFYPAEEEHQEYYQRNPENYTINAERRKKFIKEFWE